MAIMIPESFTIDPVPNTTGIENIFKVVTSPKNPTASGSIYYTARVNSCKMILNFNPMVDTVISNIHLVCRNTSGFEGIDSITITGIDEIGNSYEMYSSKIGIEYGKDIDTVLTFEVIKKVVSIECDITFLNGNLGNGSNILTFMVNGTQLPVEQPETSNVSRTKAFHAQTLPMNTTLKILSKVRDPREGMLGMANDPDNYGDLYVVGNDGKAHLTKSGIKSEVIFEGDANTTGNYKLSDSISKYKFVLIESRLNTASSKNSASQLISLDKILKSEPGNAILFSTASSSTDFRYIGINFTDGLDNFNVNAIKNTSTSSVSIERIIGIY